MHIEMEFGYLCLEVVGRYGWFEMFGHCENASPEIDKPLAGDVVTRQDRDEHQACYSG